MADRKYFICIYISMETGVKMGGLSIWHWLLVLAIVVLIFGTKRLKNIGSDLGEAIKNFKYSVSGNKEEKDQTDKASDKPTDQK